MEFLHLLVIASNKNLSLVKVEELKIYIIQCCIKILVMYLTPKIYSRRMK